MEYVVNELKGLRSNLNSEDLIENLSRSNSLYDTKDQELRSQITERLVCGLHAVLSSMLDIEEVFSHPKSFFKIGFGVIVAFPAYVFVLVFMTFNGYRLSELLKQTKRLCSAIISSPSADEEMVRNTNHILTLLIAKSPTISIYGLFTIDQTLPLRALSLVTSYTYLYLQYIN
ncbi:unnamed protein product [Pieris brassicae]|uniref:Gustatory receptor n=1 Tax=Pieris brassicae TaxID=7116 RepID=A0A9P0TS70_PIEBR|nr:unnamed protein product [Pieris brassicae]